MRLISSSPRRPIARGAAALVASLAIEAVEYARTQRGRNKIKIERIDGSAIPGARKGHEVLRGTVAWRSWDPGEIAAGRGWAPD